MTTTTKIMIKEIKSMAAGTQIKGFPLMIKTARRTFRDTDEITWQEVVFMDSSGEITGHIQLENSVPWKSKTNICIMNGILQDTDERRKEGIKLVVYECFDAATPLSYDQTQELNAEDWKKLRQDEIKGKIRHGIICAMISRNPKDGNITLIPDERCKEEVNELVDFIMTGE